MKPDKTLAFQILCHGVHRLAGGEIEPWLALGLSVDEIRLLETLNIKALQHLSRFGFQFLTIQWDQAPLSAALAHVRKEVTLDQLQDDMVRQRAPYAMMRALFGMNTLQYATRRKVLGMTGIGVGRPPSPTDAAYQRVWQLWQNLAHLPERERYVETSRRARVSLQVVWMLVSGWAEEATPARP